MSSRGGVIPAGRVALVLLAASALLLSSLGLRVEENIGLPLLFGWRGEKEPPDAVALIALDEESVAALNLPDLDQIDRWPRSIHAQLIRTLHDKGVAVIALDIAFLAAGDPVVDRDLASAMREAGNVTLLKLLDGVSLDADKTRRGAAVQWQSEPLSPLRESAAAINAFTLPDHALKKYTVLFPRTPEGIEASMPLVALQLYRPDARTTLLAVLDQLGETTLGDDLRAESRPAFFAAHIRSALRARPTLAVAIESALRFWPDASAAAQLRPLLSAYQLSDPVYINFYGPQRTIPTFSLHTLLMSPDTRALDTLRGKAVFVGLSERFQKQRDYFFTVYPAGGDSRISGVEVAATLFANLLEQKPLRAPMVWQQLAGLWLWGGLLIVAARYLSASRWLLLTLLLAMSYAAIAAMVFSYFAWWLPVVVPLLVATPALALLAIWHYYRRSDAAERAATAALSLYVPADVAAAIGRNQQLLTERHQIDAVCLLTDIVGFTALSEQREADYMHSLMNSYYRDVVAEVERHGGVVANIVGDGLLALWPITDNADNNAAQPACRAAQAIIATSDRLTQTLDEPLTTCVGLHYGPLSLGHLGAGKHFEYAPVGDTINTTSRIEACTRQLHCRILLSEPVRERLQGFVTRSRGEVRLKGKHASLLLHELLVAPDSDF